MERIHFSTAVKIILTRDQRFAADGYEFLREALSHTIAALRKDELEEHRHVSGPELIEGAVSLALENYGSMAVIVLDSWGITRDEDIGMMVFNLIEAGAFGKSEDDALSDFCGVMNLQERLLAPYRPTRELLPPSGSDASQSNRNGQIAK